MTKRQQHEFFNQTDIAEFLNVHRTTIREFTRLGMPVVVSGRKGKENLYDVGVCICWFSGHENAKQLQINLSSLDKILWASEIGRGDASLGAFRRSQLTAKNIERLKSTRDDVSFSIGFLAGAGLI